MDDGLGKGLWGMESVEFPLMVFPGTLTGDRYIYIIMRRM